MSKISTIVRYDGVALKEHSMDVADLAPALLGLSEIIKISNEKINGDRSAVKVLVKVDVEQSCFQFFIEIKQTFLQQISLLVSSENVATATAKEIAGWIGIIAPGVGAATAGLFKLYKWIADQKVSLNELDIKEDKDNIIISNPSNNRDITVNKHTYIIMNEKDTLKNIKNVVKPLTNEGYDKLQFEQDNEIVDEISSEEGKRIYNISEDSLKLQLRVNKSTSPVKLKVKKPDFLGNSMWSFVLDKVLSAKIEDTLWLEKFQKGEVSIPPGSYLDVLLRTEIELDDNNDPAGNVNYFITEVKDVIPPAEQSDLFNQ